MKFQTALKTEVSFNSELILMVIIVDYSPEKMRYNIWIALHGSYGIKYNVTMSNYSSNIYFWKILQYSQYMKFYKNCLYCNFSIISAQFLFIAAL